jgi:hypothetical protein
LADDVCEEPAGNGRSGESSLTRKLGESPGRIDCIRRRLLQFLFEDSERAMAISQELLAILVCPICKKPVRLLADNSGLKCEVCRRVYPVRDDIPVMLPEEAKVVPE